MGCVNTIAYGKFPLQSKYLNARVDVCFHYDTEHQIKGFILRDDREEPFETLILLDDGHIVRAEECQYSIRREGQ